MEKTDDESIENEDLYKDSEPTISEPFDPKKVDIITQTMVISNIVDRLKHDGFELQPDFQRKSDLWSNQAQSRLIESLMIRIPLPSFYFDSTDEDKLIVVDGLQRLTAINRFIALPADDKDKLKLCNLEYLSQYNGMIFEDLPYQLQRRINEQTITTYVIRPGTPDTVRTSIFTRINTGGLRLHPAEIRNSVYRGQAATFLRTLAGTSEFKAATNNKISSYRMLDCEFVNRTLAFYILGYTAYQGNLEEFLERVLGILQHTDMSDLISYKEDFLGSMILCHELFGKYAFRKPKKNGGYGPINKPLYEVVSATFAKTGETNRNIILQKKETFIKKYKSLFSNEEFYSSISSGTGTITSVKIRYEFVNRIIEETINND